MHDKLYRINHYLVIILFTFIIHLIPCKSLAQYAWSELLMDWMEEVNVQEADASINWEELLEELHDRQEMPLNLNTATRQELEFFPFLTAQQIENIQAYVYLKGEMQTLHELLLVEEMDKRTVDMLMPFVCAIPGTQEKRIDWKRLLKQGKSEVLARLDVPLYRTRGYSTVYQGPPQYHSLRYSFRCKNHLYVGVTAEKDAGEPFAALHNRKGYDYYGFYLLLQDIGRLQSLALGNYRLHFGQGLIVSNNFLNGKTQQVMQMPFQHQGVRRHASTDEYNYFRGVASSLRVLPRLSITAFYSHRTLDGTIKNDTLVSINQSGLHRTETEVSRRCVTTLQMTGGHLHYSGKWLRVGATGIYYYFDRVYAPQLPAYAKYYQRGQRFNNAGVDYSLRIPRLSVDGEVATGIKGIAALNRLQYSPASNYHLLLVHRYYSHDYWGFFARAFGEASRVQNENGWYLAADISPVRKWRFFSSIDFFSSPWWRYRVSKSSQGIDFSFLGEYMPTSRSNIRASYRWKKKERDLAGTNGKIILPYQHHRTRIQFNYSWNNRFSMRTFADYNSFYITGQSLNRGYQMTQRIVLNFPSIPLQLQMQASYFHTDNYDSRVYIAERGLLNTFYTPSFTGKGFRYSGLIRYDLKEYLMLLLKYGETNYNDRDEIGSGYDLIASHRRTDIQMQLRLRF